jgi:hypothetical protein
MVEHPRQVPGVRSPCPQGPTLGLSCRCPPDMRMVLIVSLCHSCFSCFVPRSKKRCHDDKSRASSIPVARWQPVVASAMEVPGGGGTLWGTTNADVADTGPQLGDSARILLHDLVVRGTSASILPVLHPLLATGGGWRMRQSLCVHRSPPRKG